MNQKQIQSRLKRLSDEFLTTFREAKSPDYRAWAYSETVVREVHGDVLLELVQRPHDPEWRGIRRVYALDRINSHTAQVIGVCDNPSAEIILALTGIKETPTK